MILQQEEEKKSIEYDIVEIEEQATINSTNINNKNPPTNQISTKKNLDKYYLIILKSLCKTEKAVNDFYASTRQKFSIIEMLKLDDLK